MISVRKTCHNFLLVIVTASACWSNYQPSIKHIPLLHLRCHPEGCEKSLKLHCPKGFKILSDKIEGKLREITVECPYG